PPDDDHGAADADPALVDGGGPLVGDLDALVTLLVEHADDGVPHADGVRDPVIALQGGVEEPAEAALAVAGRPVDEQAAPGGNGRRKRGWTGPPPRGGKGSRNRLGGGRGGAGRGWPCRCRTARRRTGCARRKRPARAAGRPRATGPGPRGRRRRAPAAPAG